MDTHIIIFCFIQSWFYLANKFGGIARDKGIRLHIVRDDTAGSTVCFGAFDGLLKVSRLISINTICFMSF